MNSHDEIGEGNILDTCNMLADSFMNLKAVGQVMDTAVAPPQSEKVPGEGNAAASTSQCLAFGTFGLQVEAAKPAAKPDAPARQAAAGEAGTTTPGAKKPRMGQGPARKRAVEAVEAAQSRSPGGAAHKVNKSDTTPNKGAGRVKQDRTEKCTRFLAETQAADEDNRAISGTEFRTTQRYLANPFKNNNTLSLGSSICRFLRPPESVAGCLVSLAVSCGIPSFRALEIDLAAMGVIKNKKRYMERLATDLEKDIECLDDDEDSKLLQMTMALKQLSSLKAVLQVSNQSGTQSSDFLQVFKDQVHFCKLEPVVEPCFPAFLWRGYGKSRCNEASFTGLAFWSHLGESMMREHKLDTNVDAEREMIIVEKIMGLTKMGSYDDVRSSLQKLLPKGLHARLPADFGAGVKQQLAALSTIVHSDDSDRFLSNDTEIRNAIAFVKDPENKVAHALVCFPKGREIQDTAAKYCCEIGKRKDRGGLCHTGLFESEAHHSPSSVKT